MKNRLSASASRSATAASASSVSSTSWICSGSRSSPAISRRPSEIDRSRTRPSWSASRANPTYIVVSALVLATATSGPACR